ncbi:MAG TPA: FKBP-type peptidyl-prolyl cis-trans isomerase [Bacteroidales bacterium]|nr:FKBP-type peptidyl-prolyl cis-trans isomerase [Bacteroidales bacterium]
MARVNRILLFSLLPALLGTVPWACSDPEPRDKPALTEQQMREPLMKANRHLNESEEDMIGDFISRYGWEMKVTGSGLRYQVYSQGSGPAVARGSRLSLAYELRLLNGQVIRNSGAEGLLTFTQGKAEVPRGLDEAVLLLRQGDRAKIIIPSHLGYGLLGDQDRIPPRATLIYDLYVKSIEN